MRNLLVYILLLITAVPVMAQEEDNSAGNNMVKLKSGYYLYFQNTGSIDKVLLSHGKEWKTIFDYSHGIVYTPWVCYCCYCWTVDELSAYLLKISYLDKSIQYNRVGSPTDNRK
jgi:hypothetical protein